MPSRNDMTRCRTPALTSFDKIKEELDPAYSYMIFERAMGEGETEFREICEALDRLDLGERPIGARQRRVFRDESRRRVLLIVKFDPGRTDRIMQEFMNIGLPEDVTFYAYGSQPKS